MKQNNLFKVVLLAMLFLSVGGKAADGVDFTDQSNGIMYKIRVQNNVPEAAVVAGWVNPRTDGHVIYQEGAVTLQIPATLTLELPSTSYDIPVIGIKTVSFNGEGNGNIYLKSVTIGTNVTSISDNAFKDCSKLQEVTIINSIQNRSKLKTIGNEAFFNCNSLTSILLPQTVTSIGAGAFKDCI